MRRSREQRCGNSGWEQRPNQTNAARASHPSRTHVISCACPITAKQRNDRFSPNRARSNAERRFCRSQLPIRHLSITIHQPSQWPAILSCSEEQIGEEAATPGQPVRACARFLDFPPAIHPPESPAAADSAAIIPQAQETSRFAGPTLRQKRCTSQHKNFATL
jgi:hypothetical protein